MRVTMTLQGAQEPNRSGAGAKTITIPSATITSKDFTQQDISYRLTQNLVDVRTYALVGSIGSTKPLLDQAKPNGTVGPEGLKASFYQFGSSGNIENARNAVHDALAITMPLLAPALDGRVLRVYFSEGTNCSYGYLTRADGTDQTAIVVLGKTSVNVGSLANSTVADFHFPDDTKKHIQTTVAHELGHVLHQCRKLEYYMALARVQEIGGGEVKLEKTTELMELERNQPKLQDLPGIRAVDLCNFTRAVKALGKGVSFYAFSGSPNEFVAETFAALAMGLPVGREANPSIRNTERGLGLLGEPFPTCEQILEAYQELGGPPLGSLNSPTKLGGAASTPAGDSNPLAWAQQCAKEYPAQAHTDARK
jgi:hypothetical protein